MSVKLGVLAQTYIPVIHFSGMMIDQATCGQSILIILVIDWSKLIVVFVVDMGYIEAFNMLVCLC